jgi:alpha-D-ribose 1-methylphosphonate 5-phosphate C-P lyase
MLPVFFYLTLSFDFAILLNMKKVIKKIRGYCVLCGARKYLDKLRVVDVKNGAYLECKNSDLCVLKMAYNKKKNKK